MPNIAIVTSFLGWCSIINIGILLISTLSIIIMKERITALHNKLFGVKQTNLLSTYFQYLACYKLATIILNIVPYIALKIIV
ncbi:hypothetical protein KCG35_12190 [Zooshikella sp. WH53]|uniref:DUF6868 domain-containing protein n=2 Tax=Zooshikella harenae TaxID=2827238 RepID=A0ABS5ZCW8_9GAMM|nr:hypothetical protein [Zooshikella harenae]